MPAALVGAKLAVPTADFWYLRLDDARGCLQRPQERALDRQLDGDRVAERSDAVQLTVDVGQELRHVEDDIADVASLWSVVMRRRSGSCPH
jgi:hypothetical protein